MGRKPILSEQQADLLAAEKALLLNLQQAVEDFGANSEDRALLTKVAAGLDELFLLVVIGEFNSGKSAFINALIGARILTEGATPTTSQINVLRYSSQPAQNRQGNERDLLEIFNPAPFLQEISVVDTPGTNAIIERHQTLTEEFVPRSDLVIFVTSAERPFTQSERQFLEKVSGWGKKIVVVVNKIDLLASVDDLNKVMQFVSDNFRQLLKLTPPIFPVSGRLALMAKTQPVPQAAEYWRASGFGALESYIFGTLDQASRIRLKLSGPLNIATRLMERYQTVIDERLDLLEQDVRTVTNIERQLTFWHDDTRRDLEARLSQVNNLLYDLNDRADRFFDDVFRVTRVFELIKTDRVKQDFEKGVVADTPQRIEQAVQETAEWLVEREARILREVNDYLRERRQAGETDEVIGQTSASSEENFDQFNYNRRMLLQQVGDHTRHILQTFDERAEVEKLKQTVRESVNRTMLTGAGAIGLGAGVAIVLGSAAADITGLLLTLVVGGIGFYIIPARRRRAKYEFRQKLEILRGQLSQVLREQFRQELAISVERMREALAPYTRFTRAEQERLGELTTRFADLHQQVSTLQDNINAATSQAVLETDFAVEVSPPVAPAALPAPAKAVRPDAYTLPYPPADYRYDDEEHAATVRSSTLSPRSVANRSDDYSLPYPPADYNYSA